VEAAFIIIHYSNVTFIRLTLANLLPAYTVLALPVSVVALLLFSFSRFSSFLRGKI